MSNEKSNQEIQNLYDKAIEFGLKEYQAQHLKIIAMMVQTYAEVEGINQMANNCMKVLNEEK